MCSPLGGLGGVLKYPDSKKRAVSAKVQTLNSTLWITQETLLTPAREYQRNEESG